MSLRVSAGSRSGSGKSTLLYCINGLEPIEQGEVVVDGVSVHAKSTDINKLRQNLGMVFQQWNSFPHLTALENVPGTRYTHQYRRQRLPCGTVAILLALAVHRDLFPVHICHLGRYGSLGKNYQ